VSDSPILALDRASFSYGGRPAVREASLTVHAGQITGLLGPNGSGKSTLLRLAAGLLPPQQGIVRLGGKDLRAMRRSEIARRIAVVPQNAPLPEAFTGWEVAEAGRTPHLGPLRGIAPTDEAIIGQALALVDAGDLADRPVGAMSGGERQRLLLARALAQEPEVLLLDEPTAHLDLPHQIAFLDLVLRFARDEGLAVLVVFHDLNLAAEYCDAISLLHNGEITARGAPENVLTPETIAAVYGLRVSVIPHPESGRPVVLLPAANRVSSHDADIAPGSRAGRESKIYAEVIAP
jgi:iron complex transport system ATP-binding protein